MNDGLRIGSRPPISTPPHNGGVGPQNGAGGKVRRSRDIAGTRENVGPYSPAHAAKGPEPLTPPRLLLPTNPGLLDACQFMAWVVAEGVGEDNEPRPELRAIAAAWLDLSKHREGGKTVALEQQGRCIEGAAHTPRDAIAWRSTATSPPDHQALLRGIADWLQRAGNLPLVRALRLPLLQKTENLRVSGTRLVGRDSGRYVLEPSGCYGFAAGSSAIDFVARFHAIICHAAGVVGDIEADAKEGPLCALRDCVNTQRQALRRAMAPATPERQFETEEDPNAV